MPRCWTQLSSDARLGSVKGSRTENTESGLRISNVNSLPPRARHTGSLIHITGEPHLLSNQPHLVGGEAIHHAAVVDVALPDDDIRHGYLYPLCPAMPWHVHLSDDTRVLMSTRVNDLGVPRSGRALSQWRPPSTNWPWVKPEAVKRLGPWPHTRPRWVPALSSAQPLISAQKRGGGQTGPRNLGILISCPTITSRVGQKPFACFRH